MKGRARLKSFLVTSVYKFGRNPSPLQRLYLQEEGFLSGHEIVVYLTGQEDANDPNSKTFVLLSVEDKIPTVHHLDKIGLLSNDLGLDHLTDASGLLADCNCFDAVWSSFEWPASHNVFLNTNLNPLKF